MRKVLPDPMSLRQMFSYDSASGVLSWCHRPECPKGWNTRYVGRPIQSLDSHGYIQVKIGQHNLRGHRVIWAMVTGAWPTTDVDHIDGNRSNNRWQNLREATRSQNNHNQHTARRSIYPRGVSIHRKTGLYRAYVNLDGRQKSLGYFKTIDEAQAAYDLKAPALLGDFFRSSVNG